MTAPVPNLDLYDRALAHITAHPEQWVQEEYRCGTGMCFAGHTAVLAGGRWLYPGHPRSDLLVAEPGDPEEDIWDACISAHDRARRLLGLTEEQADRVFVGTNTLDDLRRYRDLLARGEL